MTSSPLRLSATMANRRLLALRFIRDYIGQWGGSPSVREVAAAIGVNRSDAHRIIKSLVAGGELIRHRRDRGLMLPDAVAVAIGTVEAAGWQIDRDARRVQAPGTTALTHSQLSALRELDHPAPRGGQDDNRAQSG